MNSAWTTFLTSLAIPAAVLAEINLVRALLRERRASRTAVSGSASARSGFKDARTFWPAVAAAGAALAPSGALAEEPGSIDRYLPSAMFSLGAQPSEPPVAEKPLVISTNRPTFNDTAGIVPIGHFQLETGYTFTYRDRDGVETQTHNAPEILARLPILEDRLEIQLGTSGYVWTSSDDGTGSVSNEGFSDMTIGLRLKVLDEDGWVPRLAVQAVTTTSLGSDGISNQDVEPVFKLIWSYTLKDGWGVYGNLGVGYLSTSGERFIQGQGGVCVSYTINDKWSLFGEYYLFGPNAKGTDAAHYTDIGAAYLITPRIQLDARIGAGLNDEANNFFAGAGISFLF